MAAGRRLLVVTSSERIARELRNSPGYDPQRHLIASVRGLCLRVIPPDALPSLAAEEDITGRALTAALSSELRGIFPTVLVDEAHNIPPDIIRLIDTLTDTDVASTTYTLDPAQGIFDFAGAGVPTIAFIRSRAGARTIRLSKRFRPIAPVGLPVESPDIVATAVERAAALLSPDCEVGILTRTNAEASAVAQLLSRRGLPHRLLTSRLLATAQPLPPGVEPWQHYATREADLCPAIPGHILVATTHTARDRMLDHVIFLDTAPYPRLSAVALSRARLSAVIVKLPQ